MPRVLDPFRFVLIAGCRILLVRSPQPPMGGLFRSEALRAVYVDWKGGGQVNYLKELGEQWWSSWQHTMTRPLRLEEYRTLGIDYLVVRPEHPLPGQTPVFRNVRCEVCRL